MNYCSIEEAWGQPMPKKKKKNKKLYTTNVPNDIYDTSFLEGSHDKHCSPPPENRHSKNRYSHSRTHRNTYNKKKTRTPNANIAYDQAAQEYRNYQTESKNIKKREIPQQELLVEGFESGDELNSIEEIERTFNEVNDVDQSEYIDTDVENVYAPSTNYATETEAETDVETDVEEEIKEVVNETIENNKEIVNIENIDYRLNNLNRNVNTLLKKMDDSDFFDDESQDNIHDLILFILFGVFMIFVLDTIHKMGKN